MSNEKNRRLWKRWIDTVKRDNDIHTVPTVRVPPAERPTAPVPSERGSNIREYEIPIIQEIFQEANEDWNFANNYYYNDYNSNELESNYEPIPPTLRSPGAQPPPPPPPPSTRREGRGQPPLPPMDSEPPTVRLPRRFATYSGTIGTPIRRGAQTQSIRREYEIPLMEEVFMQADDAVSNEIKSVKTRPQGSTRSTCYGRCIAADGSIGYWHWIDAKRGCKCISSRNNEPPPAGRGY